VEASSNPGVSILTNSICGSGRISLHHAPSTQPDEALILDQGTRYWHFEEYMSVRMEFLVSGVANRAS
jgi:hypothetical protein